MAVAQALGCTDSQEVNSKTKSKSKNRQEQSSLECSGCPKKKLALAERMHLEKRDSSEAVYVAISQRPSGPTLWHPGGPSDHGGLHRKD